MDDLDAVVRAHRLSLPRARPPRCAGRPRHRTPWRTAPGASTTTKPTGAGARALLVAGGGRHDGVGVDGGAVASATGSPARGQQLGGLGAQVVAPGEAQRGQQAEADRLAVAQAAVAGDRLERVADGVAEVQHLAPAAVALVLGHDGELRPRAGQHDVVVVARAGRDALPEGAARDERRLQHLGEAGGALGARERRQDGGVGQDRGGLVVGADVVLGLGEVDAGLPAVGRVDLGHERRRDLHDRHPALVGRRDEPGEVADDAATDRDDVVVAARALGGQVRARRARPWPASCGLPRRQGERRLRRAGAAARAAAPACSSVTTKRREAPAAARAAPRAAAADPDRVARPTRRAPTGAARPAAPRGSRRSQGSASSAAPRAPRRHDRVGGGEVGRLARRQQRGERAAVARERPVGALDARPRRGGVDVEQHGRVALERRAHRAEPARRRRARRPRRRRASRTATVELLLARAEGGLALAREERRDGLAERVAGAARRCRRRARRAPRRAPGPWSSCPRPWGRAGRGRASAAATRSAPRYARSAALTSSTWSPPNFSR